DAAGIVQLRPQWWGILGLIGWSYLVASLVYVVVGDRPVILVAAMFVLYGLIFADAFGFIGRIPYLSIGSTLGSPAALLLFGALGPGFLARYRGPGGGT